MKQKREYKVYMHTNLINDKKYIGITKSNIEYRYGKNGYKYKGCPLFYKAIQKYGWDNFKHEVILLNLTKEEAEMLEVELIKYYKSNNRKYGYNIMEGGKHGGKMPDSVKNKISISNIGKNKGSKNGMFGKSGVLNHASIKIICLETKQIYGSIGEAGRILGLNASHIHNVCNNKRKSTGGLHFLYLKDYDKNKKYDLRCYHEYLYKPILCLETGEVFKSITDASIKMDIDTSYISNVCNGKLNSVKGFHFSYYKKEV